MERNELGHLIASKLESEKAQLKKAWESSRPVRHFVIDELLPPGLAQDAFNCFPPATLLHRSDDIRERKHAGAETARYHPFIREALFAFQGPPVLRLLSEITGHESVEADPGLYASGVSLMGKGDFLNPHVDNSHDAEKRRYRILNLLYYVTPGWQSANGGSLELWDDSGRERLEIPALFNRLAVMETGRQSWHSVSRVDVQSRRCCISNYCFSEDPPHGHHYRHVTTFRARPEEAAKKVVLGMDGALRNFIGRFLSNRALEKLRNPAARR